MKTTRGCIIGGNLLGGLFSRLSDLRGPVYPKKDLLFLVLSGFATTGSWLCYYDAIAQGQVSVVVPIDKLSVLLTVLFSVLVLKEKVRRMSWVGLGLLVAGTVCMAVFA